jgi:hypothetical protein
MLLHSPRILLHLPQNLLHHRILQNPQNLWIPLRPLQNLCFRRAFVPRQKGALRAGELLGDFTGVGARVGGVGVGCGGGVAGVDGFLVLA